MPAAALDYDSLPDIALSDLARHRDPLAVRLITTRNNQRLFRAAWSILKNRPDAEDCVQDTYVKAFTGPSPFTGAASLSTWLTRIVINEALGRKRTAQRRKLNLDRSEVVMLEDYRGQSGSVSPESQVLRTELSKALEAAVAQLPEAFRTVFILRDIEEMSVEDTAQALDILPQTVKSRLSRARSRLREALDPQVKAALGGTFRFAGPDCERMTQRALGALCPNTGDKNDS